MKRLFILSLFFCFVCATSAQTSESDSTAVELKEFTVKGERPLKRMKGNTLSYDAAALRERFSPATAFNLLEHIPEIKVEGESVTLTGSPKALLVINGRVSMVDAGQVVERLKALPAEQVASIEITRIATAKYNFAGALINVRTIDTIEQMTAMVENQLSLTRRLSDNGRASLMYDRGRLSLFGAASYTYNDSQNSSFYSMADGYRCDTEIRNFRNVLKLNGEAAWKFGKSAKLTADYYGYLSDETRKDWRTAPVTFIRSRRLTDDKLHSVGLELALPWQLSVSARYKSFSSPYKQYYGASGNPESVAMTLAQTSTQDIDNWRANINKDINLGKSARLSAGITGDFTNTSLSVDYGNKLTLGSQQEWNAAIYAQADFRLWEKLDVTLGLRGEKTKQLYKDKSTGKETTAWDDLWLFPTLQLALPLNERGHILQLSLQSDKEFPGYWWVSPQTTIIDERTLSVGNPNMRPSRSYRLSLMYFAGNNWMFWTGSSYTKDGLSKLPHYDEELGKTVYTGENYDLSLQNSLGAQWQKSFGRYTTSAVAYGAYSIHHIDNYYGADYKSQGLEGYLAWNNDLQLPLGKRGGKLLLHSDFYYMTPLKNGFTEWADSWNLNANARWIPTSRLCVELGCRNILRLGNMRWTKIDIPRHEMYESHYNPRTAYLRCTLTLGKQRKMKRERDEMDGRFGR